VLSCIFKKYYLANRSSINTLFSDKIKDCVILNIGKILEKFSKSSDAVIKNKKSFFEENHHHLNYVRSVNEIYIKQPRRTICKNCEAPIERAEFISHKVPYSLCTSCNHLNGLHEDTDEFASFLYKESGGSNYKRNYLDAYESRVNDIYVPKVSFLVEVMDSLHQKNSPLSVLDVGCGGGHFICACEQVGISARGVEPNQALVKLAAEKIGAGKVLNCDLDDITRIIRDSEEDVVALIGVLEHLQNPRSVIKAFIESEAKYLYLQVPLFSFSVLLEHANQDVFPRQLNAGHTHLYTKESLNHLFDEFGLKILAEWWFGTDIVDLFRQLVVKSDFINHDRGRDLLKRYFGNFIDDLQAVLDRDKKCSGVNMILGKKESGRT
jgi:2-polyprenyl-3-methyl-5-hydroxy-6-metoxy-1,4-benzoquinol methylase